MLSYISDTLQNLSENTAKQVGGTYIAVKLSELLDPKPQDTRTAQDIIDDIKRKIKE